MHTEEIVKHLDTEITKLQNAKKILTSSDNVVSITSDKHKWTDEARQRMSDSQKKRWAKRKKAA